ncbi:MAG: hypothetical protein QOD88_3760 [Mycobacterium sp.]|jgi:hypothetical protein|nr:hypothetical protein [Mycobacterium sp.]
MQRSAATHPDGQRTPLDPLVVDRAHQSLSLGSVAAKLRNQVSTNGDDARTATDSLELTETDGTHHQ